MNGDGGQWVGRRVSWEQKERVATVRCFNPDQGLMDPQMEQELFEVVQQFESMADLRVVIITGGSPDVFIRHYDVAELHRRSQKMRERGLRFDAARPVPPSTIHKLLTLIGQSRLVYIAALNGTAMGGGFEIALGCDLRVVQEGDYLLGLPEVNLGLLPGAGGTQRLTRLLGESRAMEFMLLGRTLRPAEMVPLGLAQACVGDALSHAQALAEQITLRPAKACAHIKALVREAQDRPLSRGEALERTFFCDCMIDDDAQPLMQAVGAHERSIAQAPPRGS
ncbi:MAG: enoyl-CoA hydratase/isomerase family protein [Rubrivivax sp.]